MKNYFRFKGYGLQNGEKVSRIYAIDVERLYDLFCEFEEAEDWDDLTRELDETIRFEEYEVFDCDTCLLEAMKQFRNEIVNNRDIPRYVEVFYNEM